MFERFWAAFAPLRDPGPTPGSPWLERRLLAVEGYREFAEEFAGSSFGGGLYRFHDEHSGPATLTLIAEAFPEFAARVCPFGYDWLGRQFAIDRDRVEGRQLQVLLVEPGTGEVLEIPSSFSGFHDEVLLEQADAALASVYFATWSAANAELLPLRRDQCVGYKVPLFLGGQEVDENLEVTDLDVYWSICGQLRLGALGLPPGTAVDEVSGR